jgi:Lsr2
MREVIIRIRDDIEADRYGPSDAAIADKTIEFSFDGITYEIDVTAANADQMANDFAPYIKVARRVQQKRGRKRKAAAEPVTAQQLAQQITPWDKAERARVRAWANKNGFEQAALGQIKQEVRDAYYAAHPGADELRRARAAR